MNPYLLVKMDMISCADYTPPLFLNRPVAIDKKTNEKIAKKKIIPVPRQHYHLLLASYRPLLFYEMCVY